MQALRKGRIYGAFLIVHGRNRKEREINVKCYQSNAIEFQENHYFSSHQGDKATYIIYMQLWKRNVVGLLWMKQILSLNLCIFNLFYFEHFRGVGV